jgi:hydrogenase expression/formation protein HypE
VRGSVSSGWSVIRRAESAAIGDIAAQPNPGPVGQTPGVVLDEAALPLSPAVRGACEVLGLDPLHVANEGKLLAVVAAADAERALACLRGHLLGRRRRSSAR